MIHKGFEYNVRNNVGYYVIPSFVESGLVHHCFTTRIGGVSSGECHSLNLGFKRRDSRENVFENFQRLCRCIGVDPQSLVFSDQVHLDQIYAVSQEDRGKGLYRESDIHGKDGLITNQPDISLVTFYADCVPLFFLDPIHKAIGTSHAGWRGTVKKIGVRTLKEMAKRYGTRPEECLVGIGPSIGPCCFEVDTPVKDIFEEAFSDHSFISKHESDKYHIDLWTANVIQLLEAGVLAHHITVAGLCTCCHPEKFFSHRRDKGRTGSLAAMIQLVNASANS